MRHRYVLPGAHKSRNYMTLRMFQVLDLRATGLGIKEIAAELGVNDSAVEWHWGKLQEFYGGGDAVTILRKAGYVRDIPDRPVCIKTRRGGKHYQLTFFEEDYSI